MKTFGRKMLAIYASFFLLSMLVLSLCACSTGTEIKNVLVNSLVLSESNFSGYEGDSVTVIASVYPEDATDKKITWAPENDMVSVIVDEKDSSKATISIRSTKAGTCNVTVKTSNSEVYSTFTVIVLEKENPSNPTDPSNPGEKTKYNLTISTVENGSVTADKTKFAEGEEITLTVTPDTGYLLSSLKYTNDSYEEIEIQKDENGAYKFKAPASNITILCYFEEINLYTVSIDTVDNGTVVADKTSCYPGDTVTLTVTPAEGFKIQTLKYLDNNYSYVNIEKNADGKYQFKMPASNITVRANFASIYEKVNNVVFNETELTVAKGDTVNLGYKVSPENVNYDLSFVVASTYSYYADKSIASVTAATDPYVAVSNSGVITANEIGSGQMIFAKITDKAYGGTKYFGPVKITVKDAATKFVVYTKEINVKAGDTCSIYAEANNKAYHSSDVTVRGLKVTNTCPAITFNGFGYGLNTASSIEGDFVTGEITFESTDFPTYKVQVCVYKDNVPSDIKFDKKIVVLKPNQTYTPTITIANVTEGTYTPKIEVEYDDVISLSGNTITAKKNGYGVIKASIGNIVTSSPLHVIVSDSEFIESDESYSISYGWNNGITSGYNSSDITSNNYTVSPSAYGGNDTITKTLPIVTNVNGQKMVEVYVIAENISDKSITTDITLNSYISSWIGSGANVYIRDKKAVVSVTGKTAKYSIFDISNGGIFSIDGTNEVTDASWAYATSLPEIVWKNVTLEKGNNAVFTYKCTIEDLETKDFNAVIY